MGDSPEVLAFNRRGGWAIAIAAQASRITIRADAELLISASRSSVFGGYLGINPGRYQLAGTKSYCREFAFQDSLPRPRVSDGSLSMLA